LDGEKNVNYIIEMTDICKSFPGVKALDHVSFKLRDGEVHALVGENGAGKSTLMKILSGVYVLDEGEIKFRGESVRFNSTWDAQQKGITLVYQEPQIIPNMTIMDNICLGAMPTKNAFVDRRTMYLKSASIAKKVGLRKNVMEMAGVLSMGERQMVQIAKALYRASSVIIMDEPTSSLTERETDHLFEVIRQLKSEGMGIVYISHRMDEIFKICDRVTVLKDGQYVDSLSIDQLDKRKLVNMMVGRELGMHFPPKRTNPGKEIIRVENLCQTGVFENISFSVHAGEVVGIGGLIGAGRTEVMDAIFGMSQPTSGKVFIHGKEVQIRHPMDAINNHIAYATEDRHTGLILHMSILENISLASLTQLLSGPFIDDIKRKQETFKYMNRLQVKAPSMLTRVNDLSGGNQQKVVFAKWLMRSADVYILDEPTRGIDVGAKEEIYKLIDDLARAGKAVIVISSELPELIGVSDRILVMYNGRIQGELQGAKATEKNIIEYATGVRGA
jgi:ABC-type sugar transport system ATPase subunit